MRKDMKLEDWQALRKHVFWKHYYIPLTNNRLDLRYEAISQRIQARIERIIFKKDMEKYNG